MKKKNGFSLIELLAVVAVLAILALISIPMVQDYVDKAEIKARDVNARNLLRAADNYYSYVNMEMGTEFPIVLDLPSDELKLSGGQPDSGQIIIYEDGSVFMDATFDGVTYVKDRNEANVSTDKIIGSYEDWLVEPNEYPNTLLKYRPYDIIRDQINNIYYLAQVSYEYAIEEFEEDIDLKTYLIDYVIKEELNDYDKDVLNKLPKDLKDEIDNMIVSLDGKSAMTDEEIMNVFSKPELENIYDLINVLGEDKVYTSSKMYSLLVSKNKELMKDTITIPSYVRREDGGLEKITIIGSSAFRAYVDPIEDDDDETDSNLDNFLEGLANAIVQMLTCSLVPSTDSEQVKKIIIPEGIEEIQDLAFSYCAINNVTLPDSLKKIGSSSFSANSLNKIKFPNKLEIINDNSFAGNNLVGELIIPKSVTIIGSSAFEGNLLEFDDDEENEKNYPSQLVNATKLINGNQNKLTNVTFQEGSKIENIGSYAFADNALTTVTIPGSVKEIGNYAFDCSTLTSAHIKRTQGADLIVDPTAFGTIIPTYGN